MSEEAKKAKVTVSVMSDLAMAKIEKDIGDRKQDPFYYSLVKSPEWSFLLRAMGMAMIDANGQLILREGDSAKIDSDEFSRGRIDALVAIIATVQQSAEIYEQEIKRKEAENQDVQEGQ